MKRTLLLICGWAALLPALTATATDFGLNPRPPGPGHLMLSYWWKFNKGTWELVPPEAFTLSGGGELRVQMAGDSGLAAICRDSTHAERDLLAKKDPAAQDAYFRTLLPSGIIGLKLVSQRDNPLPVNGLINVEAVYSFNLGGVNYRAAYMVNWAPEKQTTTARSQPQAAAVPAAPAQPSGGEYFTAVVVAPEDQEGKLYQAFQQLMATARLKPSDAAGGQSLQYVSHGMLGR